VKFGLNLPPFGNFADVDVLVDLAVTAEEAGWDGFFLWDHIIGDPGVPFVDPWVALSAIAAATRRVRIGTMVTPLPRRRPWVYARQVTTLDHLSHGRVIAGVGIGGDGWREYSAFGEDPDSKLHGAMLDEALEIVTGLWSGEAFSYTGEHYTIADAQFLPIPVQSPRIPVWVAGFWPRRRPFRRAANWDGAFPIGHEQDMMPDDIRTMLEYIGQHRTVSAPFDVAVNGRIFSPGDIEQPVTVRDHEDAGVTWWMDVYRGVMPIDQVRATIAQGPPER
jgi:alkanesulfonate monooxygenase SsuD/methylene tetrahydromethanopterin reductase-like flavin-dependent oxidoreductase (luciferase family)